MSATEETVVRRGGAREARRAARAAPLPDSLKPVRPGARALQVTQDRLAEKDFARGLALDTAPYRAVENEAELKAALAALGTPAILKTRRLGYDGKGQVRIATADMAEAALRDIGGTSNILEGVVAFTTEIAEPDRDGGALR